ncbi:SH2 domain-containing protein [Loa loa]|uniref:SH2 domain-containing protein n=1 Tax=Loa loa TaxID=7209 RepID=A0A1I7VK77_LOALO|nr:SH2 domain-containing protein [Loa loa]EFO20951.2 SH2 domain-containing protein [Loa loa]
MRDMLGRPLFKFFHLSAATAVPPSSSTEYHQLKEDKDDERHQHNSRATSLNRRTDPMCIPKTRKENSLNEYAFCEGLCDNEYMLVDINQRLCKSVDIEKRPHDANMDQLDRVPVDFSAPSGPTIITDPDEVEEILKCGESRAIYKDHSKIYGLASCSMYRAERWFHHNADRSKVERMLQRTGGEDGSFLVRVNQRNCLILTMCHHQKIYNIYINVKVEGHKTTFFIETLHQFSNLIDLVKYYTQHQGLLLPCKLTRGVALRWPDCTKRGITNRLCVEEDY